MASPWDAFNVKPDDAERNLRLAQNTVIVDSDSDDGLSDRAVNTVAIDDDTQEWRTWKPLEVPNDVADQLTEFTEHGSTTSRSWALWTPSSVVSEINGERDVAEAFANEGENYGWQSGWRGTQDPYEGDKPSSSAADCFDNTVWSNMDEDIGANEHTCVSNVSDSFDATVWSNVDEDRAANEHAGVRGGADRRAVMADKLVGWYGKTYGPVSQHQGQKEGERSNYMNSNPTNVFEGNHQNALSLLSDDRQLRRKNNATQSRSQSSTADRGNLAYSCQPRPESPWPLPEQTSIISAAAEEKNGGIVSLLSDNRGLRRNVDSPLREADLTLGQAAADSLPSNSFTSLRACAAAFDPDANTHVCGGEDSHVVVEESGSGCVNSSGEGTVTILGLTCASNVDPLELLGDGRNFRARQGSRTIDSAGSSRGGLRNENISSPSNGRRDENTSSASSGASKDDNSSSIGGKRSVSGLLGKSLADVRRQAGYAENCSSAKDEANPISPWDTFNTKEKEREDKFRNAIEVWQPSESRSSGKNEASPAEAIEALIGKWRDEKGSQYEVMVCSPGRSLDVRTTRPDGTVRFTKALIRLEEKWGEVVWGQNFVLLLSPAAGEQLSSFGATTVKWLWRKGRNTPFVWTRRNDGKFDFQ